MTKHTSAATVTLDDETLDSIVGGQATTLPNPGFRIEHDADPFRIEHDADPFRIEPDTNP